MISLKLTMIPVSENSEVVRIYPDTYNYIQITNILKLLWLIPLNTIVIQTKP